MSASALILLRSGLAEMHLDATFGIPPLSTQAGRSKPQVACSEADAASDRNLDLQLAWSGRLEACHYTRFTPGCDLNAESNNEVRSTMTANWSERDARLRDLADHQIFFVGGAPRSGTTWLQQLLDAHPEVSCCGEALVPQKLAPALDAAVAGWREAVASKNNALFAHTGGFPPPDDADADHLLATAVLLALDRGRAGRHCRAVGEKTPENVFLFPRLQRLFPGAKLVVIAREPRDLLASAWHMFRGGGDGEDADKLAFVRGALPALDAGARATLALLRERPEAVRAVTYEALHGDAMGVATGLFGFLGMSVDPALVTDCVSRTRFDALAASGRGGTAGRPFLRAGAVGGWRATLPEAAAALVARDLGWSYPFFGWTL
jgi:hypothetical protein